MRIPGQRIKRTRLIQAENYVVAVEVEMVIPVDDPSEPCYESETVQLLREIKEHADRGDLVWLTKQGKVYAALGAAWGTEGTGALRDSGSDAQSEILIRAGVDRNCVHC